MLGFDFDAGGRLIAADAIKGLLAVAPDGRVTVLADQVAGDPIRYADAVVVARNGAEATARNLGLTRTTRFVNVLELGLVRNSSNESPTQKGWEIGFELPLFDWGGARVARAEGIYMQSLHRAAETAINARSEVRESYSAYRTSYDVAKHFRDEVVPLRKTISEENLLRYNGMIIGIFELLADSRDQVSTVMAAIGAEQQFWLADAALQASLVGRPMNTPLAAMPSAPAGGAAPH